jgi:chemotaxis protein MotA
MLVIIGWLIVGGAVIGGFMYSGGRPASLFVIGEYMIILGVFIGYMVGASPVPILKLIIAKVIQSLKGTPYGKDMYLDVIKPLYELFMVAREQGVVGIEEHVANPHESAIFKKYPRFLSNHHAVCFMQDALRPIIDGRVKGDQLKETLEEDLDRIYEHNAHATNVMTKAGDALPGIGIVAAVLGIVITMGSIGGSKEEIGHHVASALVGTFLGILVSYGFVQPLISSIEFINADELSFYQVMSNVIVSYASGAPPMMAAEAGRKAIPEDRQPGSEELETLLKALTHR